MGVLDGVRVLDLGRYISCPYCCQLLADMGAEVIKIEKVGKGDDGRHFGPYVDGVSLYVPTFSRNKKGITMQFRDERAKELLQQLIAKSDIVVENFRPGTMEKMGLSYEEVKKINPRIIMASISGFGQTGPESGRAMVDVVALALSGMMSLTGTPESGPMIVGTQIADHVAGIVCALGCLSALYEREKTGAGQYIDTAMIECLVPMLQTILPDFAMTGHKIGLHGNTDMLSCPADCYKAQDGYVIMYAGSDLLYGKLSDALGIPEMKDEKFSRVALRNENKEEVESILRKWVSERTADEVEQAWLAAGIPAAKVSDVEDVYNSEQLRSRNFFVDVEVPGIGKVPFAASPVRLSAHSETKYKPAPQMGEHNRDVYQGILGLTDEEIKALEDDHVI